MPPIRPDQPLKPSVLDRLIDDDPSNSREAPKSRTQVIRELKQSVRRDLENLLNTRRRSTVWPEHLTDLDLSLVGYGLADIAKADLGSSDARELFRRRMENVIRTFEPRFRTVSVAILDSGGQADRTLRFRIDGMLRAEPSPEPVAFDSAIEPTTGTIEVRGARS